MWNSSRPLKPTRTMTYSWTSSCPVTKQETNEGARKGALVVYRSFAALRMTTIARRWERLLLPGEAGVGAIADFGEFLGEGQEFLSLVGEQLVQGSETNLTLQEVLELGPVRLLGIE